MLHFLSGTICFGYVLAGLFFLKFWRKSGDTLFLAFAIAFWLLAANEAVLAWHEPASGQQGWYFLPRLVAYSLIALAIFAKNRRRSIR